MNEDRTRSRQQRKRGAGVSFLALFGYATLLVLCFLAGFFFIGPVYRKSAATQDLRVQAPKPPGEPHHVTRRHSGEPAVQVIERKAPIPPREKPEDQQEPDNGIQLEIEHPVTPPDNTNEAAPEDQNPEAAPQAETPVSQQLYRVVVKGFADEESASKAADMLSAKGYAPIINRVITDRGTEYRVQVGAFRNRDNADRVAADVTASGLDAAVASSDE